MTSLLRSIPIPTARAVVLYTAGIACLILTALMNRHAAVSQAATEHGRELIGAGAMLIDIVGLVVFGTIAGNLLAQRKRMIGGIVLLVTIGSAVYSVTSIVSFVAQEMLSVEQSRKDARQAQLDRVASDGQAAKERREAQERLAQSTLGVLQSQMKDAGRKEKRQLSKDLAKNSGELIDSLGKEQAARPTSSGTTQHEIALRPDAATEVLSWISAMPERTVQVTRMAFFAVLLILFKLLAFPLAGFYSQRKADVVALRTPDTASVPSTGTLTRVPDEIVIEADKLIAAPVAQAAKAEEPAKKATTTAASEPPAEPAAEWRDLLDGLGHFHPRKGPLRPPLDRKVVGYHWATWLYAYGHTGAYSKDQMTKLHEQFCLAAWRELGDPTSNTAKSHLYQVAAKLDRKTIAKKGGNSGPTTWHIEPVPAAKVRRWLTKAGVLTAAPAVSLTEATKAVAAEPAQEEALADKEATVGSVIPFAGGSAAVSPPPAKPVRGLAQLRGVPDLDAMRHAARMDKTTWRSKGHTPRPQYLHRFSRARAA